MLHNSSKLYLHSNLLNINIKNYNILVSTLQAERKGGMGRRVENAIRTTVGSEYIIYKLKYQE